MKSTGGAQVKIEGSIAYASQNPWIMNDSVRNNILFGKNMNPTRYNETIKYASLGPDL